VDVTALSDGAPRRRFTSNRAEFGHLVTARRRRRRAVAEWPQKAEPACRPQGARSAMASSDRDVSQTELGARVHYLVLGGEPDAVGH